jgi:hypothetical protein
MTAPFWMEPEIYESDLAANLFPLFPPFAESLKLLAKAELSGDNELSADGEPIKLPDGTFNGSKPDNPNEGGKGKGGDKIKTEQKTYDQPELDQLNAFVGGLGSGVNKLGTLVPSDRMQIQDFTGYHGENKHGVTPKQAQEYVDNSNLMFEQYTTKGEKRNTYLSGDGNTVVAVEGGRAITAYPKEKFDKVMQAFVEELKKYD